MIIQSVSVKIRTKILAKKPGKVILHKSGRLVIDKNTTRVVKDSGWNKNLVLDKGLNSLARQAPLSCTPASASANCSVGSGTNANQFASGAITFTQVATTITASAPFFTLAMVGGIFKYGTGTGGVEYYITAFTSSTIVTVDTSAAVVATVGTVWMVQQTALQTFLYNYDTYQTNTGDCSTTNTGSTQIHQRTYVFNKSAVYNVNEVAWAPDNSGTICGRLVLPSTDSVGATNIYVVIIAITFTYAPASPTAVSNVGTGFDTSGAAMIEYWNGNTINSNGTTNTTNGSLDSATNFLVFATAIYTQNGTIQTSPPATWTNILSGSSNWVNVPATRGQMKVVISGTISIGGTTTIYGLGFNPTGAIRPPFDILLTTPVVLSAGTFAPNATFTNTYSRTLNN